jgi:hypothetical protein
MGWIDAMALATGLPDCIAISSTPLWLLLVGTLTLSAVGIAIARTPLVFFLALWERVGVRALVARKTRQPGDVPPPDTGDVLRRGVSRGR